MKNKNVLVLGLGRFGSALAKNYLKKAWKYWLWIGTILRYKG